MNPTDTDVHVNTPLSNVSVAFMQAAKNFVADRVFPNVPSTKRSDRYYVYNRGDFNRDEMAVRAPSSESAGGGYRVDNTPNFYCPTYAFHKDIDDEMRDNADAVLSPDEEATNFCTTKALIKREKLWVSKFFTTGVWTRDWTGTSGSPSGNYEFLQWNDANSTPIEDIREAKTYVLESTGFEPNKLVIGQRVMDVLIDHPDIIDRVKYGQTQGGPAKANAQVLAQIFELDEVLVMKSIENTAAEAATASHSFIGGKKALLAYCAPAPGKMTPSAGYNFTWTGHLGASAYGGRILKFRIPQIKSDRVEIEMAFDQKVISADLGTFFTTVVA